MLLSFLGGDQYPFVSSAVLPPSALALERGALTLGANGGSMESEVEVEVVVEAEVVLRSRSECVIDGRCAV